MKTAMSVYSFCVSDSDHIGMEILWQRQKLAWMAKHTQWECNGKSSVSYIESF